MKLQDMMKRGALLLSAVCFCSFTAEKVDSFEELISKAKTEVEKINDVSVKENFDGTISGLEMCYKNGVTPEESCKVMIERLQEISDNSNIENSEAILAYIEQAAQSLEGSE